VLGRVGGEEFAILLPGASAEGAAATAERLRVRFAAEAILFAGHRIAVSASFGVASYQPADGTIATTLTRADGALYQAKAGGRNCVIAADPPIVVQASIAAA
jgi:diguanylate cyclase (GGDEF)-like protein